VTDNDVESRLRQIEDRFALRDLSLDYCRAVDDRDLETLGELFCVDGEFVHGDQTVSAVGREAVRDFYSGRFVGMGPSVHIAHTQRLDAVTEQTATGTVMGSAQMAINGRTVVAAIRYQDEYRRSDGRWRFARRTLRFWYLMPLDELPYRLGEKDRRRWPGEPSPVHLPESLESWQKFYA
jgi:hypothetical protein